jgi:MinD superfamily P-loop ATPase
VIVSVASGKGGTGKTTVAVNLALSLKNVQFLDCDVEEPNAHLFLKPVISETISAYIPIPKVAEEKCDCCGRCQEVCAFNSIAVLPGEIREQGSVLIFPHLCHGCGACSFLCPLGAIHEVKKEIGIVEKGLSDGIQFVHGKLNIGEAMSPPLIRQVKKHVDPAKTVIIDAPPGTTCPVIESVRGSDYCILVTEPTPFGLNDLILAVEMLKTIGVPFGIILNRYDIGDDCVDVYARENGIPVLMKIPFDREIASLYSKGLPIIGYKSEYDSEFKNLLEKINILIGKTNLNPQGRNGLL